MTQTKNFTYIHGYSKDEQNRLRRQAEFGEFLLYQSVNFSNVTKVLEVGCGVGAQTAILLRRFPKLRITGIDLSHEQLSAAQDYLSSLPVAEGRFQLHHMDATDLKFEKESFEAAFFCWILEHVPSPAAVIQEVFRVLKPGAQVVASEVMNFSFFLDPYSPSIWRFWLEFNDYQYENAGDPFVGVKLGELLTAAGFAEVRTEVKTLFYDRRCPADRKKTLEYWRDLMLSGADELIAKGRVTKDLVQAMQAEFELVIADPKSIFFYSFMQAQAIKPV